MEFFGVNENSDVKPVELIPIDVNNHNAVDEFAAFARTVEQGLPMEMPVEEGAKTVVARLAIVASSVTGQIVKPDYTFN